MEGSPQASEAAPDRADQVMTFPVIILATIIAVVVFYVVYLGIISPSSKNQNGCG